jgi:hypothetical protein
MGLNLFKCIQKITNVKIQGRFSPTVNCFILIKFFLINLELRSNDLLKQPKLIEKNLIKIN